MNKIHSLSARYVIGHDGADHVVYENGQVVWQGDTILFVGQNYQGAVDVSQDMGLSIISPGFIDLDADIDTDHALIDVAFPKDEKDRFAIDRKSINGDPYTDEDFYIRQKYSIAQLIKNGITTAMPIEGELFHGFSQTYKEHEIMAQVGAELGYRLYVGPSFRSATQRALTLDVDSKNEEKFFTDALDFYNKFDGSHGGLIKSFVNPCQLTLTRIEILQSAMDFAKKHHAPMRLHACEGVHEWDYTLHHYNKTTIDWFEQVGLLSPNLLIPHCVTAKNSELVKLAQNGVSVIHTPFAEANVGSALLSYGKYQHYGINMTMGTDAQPDDMIRNLRFAWDLDRLCWRKRMFYRYSNDNTFYNLLDDESDYPRTTAADFFRAATTNGAKALLRDDIGKLSPGAKADIIVIDLDNLEVGPHQDPIRTMIMSCTGANVTTTIINGKFLMRDNALIGMDEPALLAQGQQVYNKFIGLYSAHDLQRAPTDTLFPPSFKVIK